MSTLPGTARMHPDDAAECERTEEYWRSQIAREIYAKADEISRLRIGAIVLGEAGASVIRAVGDMVGKMPAEPRPTEDKPARVWPQDHADDVTVVGDVLTGEPGPEITTVTDADGYAWLRVRGCDGWCHAPQPLYRLSWASLVRRYGPLRAAS